MQSYSILALAAMAAAQGVPPPSPVILSTTKSGVLPVLPPNFTGVETLEGAIVNHAPPNASYTGLGGPAQVQSNLPAATYTATLPAVPFDGLAGVVTGTITGSSTQGQSGTTFTVNLQGLPDVSQYGPFVYHIHDMPVPADGNCTSTMGHFDPTNVGEYYTCGTSSPQTCQVGDLAGKHGMIMTGSTFQTSYNDPYLSTDPSSPYFFGSKSIVVHTHNTTRLTCANFMQGGAASTPGATPTPIGGMPTATPPPMYTGAANKAVAGSGAVVGGFAALVGLLL